ncbi:hypothetical protein EJB05_47272, partial [Eragrostis curvula]
MVWVSSRGAVLYFVDLFFLLQKERPKDLLLASDKNAIMSTFINKFVNTEHQSSPEEPTLAAKSELPRSLHMVPSFDDLSSCYGRKGSR